MHNDLRLKGQQALDAHNRRSTAEYLQNVARSPEIDPHLHANVSNYLKSMGPRAVSRLLSRVPAFKESSVL